MASRCVSVPLILLIIAATVCARELPFHSRTRLPGVTGVTSVNIGDIDKDGLPDIAVFEGGDLDLDGDLDLVGGRSFGENEAYVWYNNGQGTKWSEQIVDKDAGMYCGVVGDVDHDGDIDIIAPHAYSKGQPV